MRTLTIHAALGELKLLDKKITSKIGNSKFVGIKKNSADKVSNTLYTVEEFINDTKASFQSVTDLIELRDEIKSKIVVSNATTMVQVGKLNITVADAIERKNSINYKKQLLSELTRQYNLNLSSVNHKNETVEDNLDSQISLLVGSNDNKSKVTQSDDIAAFAKGYRDKNLWAVIDPLSIKKEMDKLEEEIADFENNADVALSVSNAITTIEVNK